MSRYIPNTEEQRRSMLETIGARSVEELFRDIPPELRFAGDLRIPRALSEPELLAHLRDLAGRNATAESHVCFLGAGVYDHFVPLVIDHLVSRQEFTTSYTPYQPEISQGTLQAIFEYQTMVCELTGMDISNASMYDGASALAEAAMIACAAAKREEVLVARSVHPHAREVLATYAAARGISVREVPFGPDGRVNLQELEALLSPRTGAVVVQNPNFFGVLETLEALGDRTHDAKALFVVSTDLLPLALLEPPGAFGADVVVGDGQPLGQPMSFGGPAFGFFATTKALMRKMPGRVVGQTVDRRGSKGYVLTLQAREQHIRREKATSNICSNQNLCILRATIHLSLLGPRGLRDVAASCFQKAAYARDRLVTSGAFTPLFDAPFFREFALKTPEPVEHLNARLLKDGILGGYDLGRSYHELAGGWLVAVTEKRSREEIETLAEKAGVRVA
ncbi:MAG TPA: aminomethyl-transferring glycine dehydrogenase subunit GcvPA [Synergistaceae bacterium]|nr:aminomethyl-transferring glycine dehydrogenase subunit GcvPA [Synergistaceae bacterium]HQH78251.1 aminomethyl-transferring glycine dehydrogenase subunit GcvPA [Synergistaceae bacterium]HQK25730.1 aminomethyl-transferring glycine dehydrogenase subunit GcvPA [Synergistaceae bacterium]